MRPLALVTVYRATKYDPNRDEVIRLPFMGTRQGLKLAALTVVEDSGIEVDESELDDNWLYHPKT